MELVSQNVREVNGVIIGSISIHIDKRCSIIHGPFPVISCWDCNRLRCTIIVQIKLGCTVSGFHSINFCFIYPVNTIFRIVRVSTKCPRSEFPSIFCSSSTNGTVYHSSHPNTRCKICCFTTAFWPFQSGISGCIMVNHGAVITVKSGYLISIPKFIFQHCCFCYSFLPVCFVFCSLFTVNRQNRTHKKCDQKCIMSFFVSKIHEVFSFNQSLFQLFISTCLQVNPQTKPNLPWRPPIIWVRNFCVIKVFTKSFSVLIQPHSLTLIRI